MADVTIHDVDDAIVRVMDLINAETDAENRAELLGHAYSSLVTLIPSALQDTVLALRAKGFQQKEIAIMLGVSPATIKRWAERAAGGKVDFFFHFPPTGRFIEHGPEDFRGAR